MSGGRDEQWLRDQLEAIWSDYFSDVKRRHPIRILFGRPAKTRLGSIRYDQRSDQAIIRINGLFQRRDMPAMMVKATIVHELCHYAHGFHSGLSQLYRYPHAGGVVRREFEERGLGDLYQQQKSWLKEHWPKIVRRHF